MTSALPWSPNKDPTAALIGDELLPLASLGALDDARRNVTQPNHYAIASVVPDQGFNALIDVIHEGAPVSSQRTLRGNPWKSLSTRLRTFSEQLAEIFFPTGGAAWATR